MTSFLYGDFPERLVVRAGAGLVWQSTRALTLKVSMPVSSEFDEGLRHVSNRQHLCMYKFVSEVESFSSDRFTQLSFIINIEESTWISRKRVLYKILQTIRVTNSISKNSYTRVT